MPRVEVRLLVLTVLCLFLGTAYGQTSEPDGAFAGGHGQWLVFSLPQELKHASGFNELYSTQQGYPRLRITPLLEHPVTRARESIGQVKAVVVHGAVADSTLVDNSLALTAHALQEWESLAKEVGPYTLQGGSRPSPLSLETRTELGEIRARLTEWQSLDREQLGQLSKEILAVDARLKELAGSRADRYLVSLLKTHLPQGPPELATLTSGKRTFRGREAVVVTNQLQDETEEIAFVTVDGQSYALSFRKKAEEDNDLAVYQRTVVGSLSHTTQAPSLSRETQRFRKERRALDRAEERLLLQLKAFALSFFVLILTSAVYHRAGVTWEVCRSRESLSSRETYRTFRGALKAWMLLIGFAALVFSSLPSERNQAFLDSLSPSYLPIFFGCLALGSLLPPLGARLGCRFGKKQCQGFAALGFFAGVAALVVVAWTLLR